MKKPYQFAAAPCNRCGSGLRRRWAAEKNPVVQPIPPIIEILTLAKQGAGELIREAGFAVDLVGNSSGNGGFQGRAMCDTLAALRLQQMLALQTFLFHPPPRSHAHAPTIEIRARVDRLLITIGRVLDHWSTAPHLSLSPQTLETHPQSVESVDLGNIGRLVAV